MPPIHDILDESTTQRNIVMLLYVLLVVLGALLTYLLNLILIQPRSNPLRNLPGPPSRGFLEDHLGMVMK